MNQFKFLSDKNFLIKNPLIINNIIEILNLLSITSKNKLTFFLLILILIVYRPFQKEVNLLISCSQLIIMISLFSNP